MKKIIYWPILVVFLSFSSSSLAQINCPGVSSVWPFVSHVEPVPFPQCAYLGYATHKHSKVNHCKQIHKKLSQKFSQKLKNWSCSHFLNQQYNYFFTFAPLETSQRKNF